MKPTVLGAARLGEARRVPLRFDRWQTVIKLRNKRGCDIFAHEHQKNRTVGVSCSSMSRIAPETFARKSQPELILECNPLSSQTLEQASEGLSEMHELLLQLLAR